MVKDSTGEVEPCRHCGLLMEPGAALRDEQGDGYCCHGCLEAAAFIRAGGWDSYYERRAVAAPRPEEDIAAAALDAPSFLSEAARPAEGGMEIELQVGGLRCAACTWLVERALKAQPGVEEVQVSYGSGRASLVWDPSQAKLSSLARIVASLGYRLAPARGVESGDTSLVARFGLAAFAAMNTMMMAIAVYLGWFDDMAERHAQAFRFISLLLATPATLWSAQPFFIGAYNGLRYRVATMDLPLAIAMGALYLHGVWAFFAGAEGYLDSLCMLIALLLGGRLVEGSTRRRAEAAASHLLAVAPTTARRKVGEDVEEVSADELEVGDQVVVPRGMQVPADGVVISGSGSADLSLLTGEAEPVEIAPGDKVPVGATIRSGAIELEVQAVGASTTLARMAEAVTRARSAKPAHQRFTDRIAPIFTVAVLAVASVTFAVWYMLGGMHPAIEATIAVLVVACPCALALATPAAMAAGLAAAARGGAWVREADVLMRLSEVDTLFLDKTGTLTMGKPQVVAPDEETLRLAASLDRWSAHPIARALIAEAAERNLALANVTDVVEQPGIGIDGVWEGKAISLRSSTKVQGVALWVDGREFGHLRLEDVIRDDTAEVLDSLGVPVAVYSGDNSAAVASVAKQLELTAAVGDYSPEEKAAEVVKKQGAGAKLAFVGDGLNDAPAIASAHVGVAMHGGTDATIAAADVVVFGRSLLPVSVALTAGRHTRSTLRGLAIFSLTYNVIAVSAAALGYVNPLVAAIIMPLSSLTVIIGAASLPRRVANVHRHHLFSATSIGNDGGNIRLPIREGGEAGAVS